MPTVPLNVALAVFAQRDVARGIRSEEENPFELFIGSTDIRYTYYKESHRVLGNTFGMLVLQDFQALTPNLLARTVETVEGGGLVVLLLKTMDSLKQLYTMSMVSRLPSCHARPYANWTLTIALARVCLLVACCLAGRALAVPHRGARGRGRSLQRAVPAVAGPLPVLPRRRR